MTPLKGMAGSISVSAMSKENPNAEARKDTIVIGLDNFADQTKKIAVLQAGKTFGKLVNQMEFSYTATQQTLTIETDGNWTATESQSWISISPASGSGRSTLTISVTENTATEDRDGTVTVSVGSTKQTIKIVQRSRYINISYDDLISNSKPTTIQLSISSNTDWTATSSDESWLTVDKKQGTGDATLTLSVADNPSIYERTATMTIVTPFETKVLSFTQPGRTLTVSTTSLSFTSDGGTSGVITVTTDGSYKVTTSDAWLTINETGNTFTVSASENTSEERTAIITVALTNLVDGENLTRSITVTQAKNNFIGLCPDSNHPHIIDLGLSVKWACCNVGASSPIDYGGYYAWGETEKKTTYDWSTYKWCNGTMTSMTKYCGSSSYGTVDNKTELELSDDAAHVKWGDSWRMPTLKECQALANCTPVRTAINGVNGFKFTGSNGASIFLPVAGDRSGGELFNAGSSGYYWSSTLNESGPSRAYGLYFGSGNAYWGIDGRYNGQSVRPVR